MYSFNSSKNSNFNTASFQVDLDILITFNLMVDNLVEGILMVVLVDIIKVDILMVVLVDIIKVGNLMVDILEVDNLVVV